MEFELNTYLSEYEQIDRPSNFASSDTRYKFEITFKYSLVKNDPGFNETNNAEMEKILNESLADRGFEDFKVVKVLKIMPNNVTNEVEIVVVNTVALKYLEWMTDFSDLFDINLRSCIEEYAEKIKVVYVED